MRATLPTRHGVFQDYLSVTCSPADSFVGNVRPCLLEYGLQPVSEGLYRLSHGGTVKLMHDKRGFDYFSATGQVLDYLRMQGGIHPLVGCLAVVPHNVSRFDIARDQADLDTPRYLSKIYQAGRRGEISLGRKAVLGGNVKKTMGSRWDGRESGTVYFNPDASGRTGARVYDKKWHLQDKFGISIIEPELLRIEVIARKGYATLHDVINPDALFFHLASPDLCSKPADVLPWERAELNPMQLERINTKTDWQRVADVIEGSSDLHRLSVLLSSGSPAMVDLALNRIRARLLSVQNSDALKPAKTGSLDR